MKYVKALIMIKSLVGAIASFIEKIRLRKVERIVDDIEKTQKSNDENKDEKYRNHARNLFNK